MNINKIEKTFKDVFSSTTPEISSRIIVENITMKEPLQQARRFLMNSKLRYSMVFTMSILIVALITGVSLNQNMGSDTGAIESDIPNFSLFAPSDAQAETERAMASNIDYTPLMFMAGLMLHHQIILEDKTTSLDILNNQMNTLEPFIANPTLFNKVETAIEHLEFSHSVVLTGTDLVNQPFSMSLLYDQENLNGMITFSGEEYLFETTILSHISVDVTSINHPNLSLNMVYSKSASIINYVYRLYDSEVIISTVTWIFDQDSNALDVEVRINTSTYKHQFTLNNEFDEITYDVYYQIVHLLKEGQINISIHLDPLDNNYYYHYEINEDELITTQTKIRIFNQD